MAFEQTLEREDDAIIMRDNMLHEHAQALSRAHKGMLRERDLVLCDYYKTMIGSDVSC